MSAADRLDRIEARNVPTTWFSDRQADTAALVAALRAVLEEIDKRKGTVGGRLTLADVLHLRIEEALS